MPNSLHPELTAERLEEYCTNAGVKPTIDRDKGIIYGVKILGSQSKNKGSKHFNYPSSTRERAAKLYEGAVSNVDHHLNGQTISYRDRIGVIRNVSPKEDGLYADYHFNPKHELAEQLCWDAEHAPEKLGFSHLGDGRVNRSNPLQPVVEEITHVESVDLVANPASTNGLFESESLPDDPAQLELCEHGLSACSDARLILLGTEPIEVKKSRLCEVLSVWHAELTGVPVINKETSVMDWKDITREGLQENRKDLVEQLTGTDENSKLVAEVKALKESIDAKDAEIKSANDKLAEAQAEKDKQAKATAIAEARTLCEAAA